LDDSIKYNIIIKNNIIIIDESNTLMTQNLKWNRQLLASAFDGILLVVIVRCCCGGVLLYNYGMIHPLTLIT